MYTYSDIFKIHIYSCWSELYISKFCEMQRKANTFTQYLANQTNWEM